MKRLFLPLLVLFILLPIYNQAQDQLSGPVPTIVDPTVTDPNGYFQAFMYNAGVQEYEIGCGVNSVDAIARFTDIGNTTDYTVESIPYKPVRFGYVPSLPGQQILPDQDDKFFDIYNLGDFNVCFYDNSYNQYIMNDNGVVSFDLSRANQAVGGDPSNGGWRLFYSSAEAAAVGGSTVAGDPIKLGANGNQFLLNNAIYLPGHDLFTTNLPAGAEFYWNVYGTAPNRRLVIGLYEIPMYGCFSVTQTHQIIIYETTNIIEIHIKNIDICDTWNPSTGPGGFTLVGIQNDNRDKSAVAPGRDTDEWAASFEAWRFIPDGGAVRPEFAWYTNYDNTTHTGDLYSTNEAETFSPTATTLYTAEVRYIDACSGELIIYTQDFLVRVDDSLNGEIDELVPTDDATETVTLCEGDTYVGHFTATSSITNPIIGYQWYEYPNVDVSIPANVLSTTENYAIPQPTSGTHRIGCLVTVYEADGVTVRCTVTDEVIVNFIPIENPSFAYPQHEYCATTDTNPLPINVITPFGTFTIDNGGVIDPTTGLVDLAASGAGDDNTGHFIITYTTPNPNCGDSATYYIDISGGAPTLNYGAVYCITGADATPTFSPTGGTFTIDNGATIDTATGFVDISTLTVGTTYIVTYTVGGVCGGSTDDSFTVSATADPTFSYPDPVCLDDTATLIPDSIATSGGNFTINTGTINATTGDLAGNVAGTYEVTYTTVGCVESSTITVEIHAIENADFSFASTFVCKEAGSITPTLDANANTGGTFTILPAITINASTGEIDLSTATAGTIYDVTYTTSGTCSVATTVQLEVKEQADASFAYTDTEYCLADNFSVAASSIATAGGTFSINGGGTIDATTGVVDLNATGVGSFEITYSLTGDCPSSSMQTITIEDEKDASFIYPTTACIAGANPLPNTIATAGGTFSIVGNTATINANTGELDLSTTTAGTTYTIEYNFGGNCPSSSTQTITITASDDSSFTYNPTQYCNDATNPLPILGGSTPSGGTFSINNGGVIDATTGEVDLTASGLGADNTGVFTISYQTAGTCSTTSSFDITIILRDDANFDYPTSTCIADANPMASNIITSGGTFSVDQGATINPNTGELDLSTTQEGITYTITYHTAGTCDDTQQQTVLIDQSPNAFAPTTILESCSNGNGTANFDIASLEAEILQGQANVSISFHPTEAFAYANTNVINTMPYAVISGNVWARVENLEGCVAVVEVPVTINNCILNIPSGFSPVSTIAENQTFNIPGIRDMYPNFEIYIYNRYGNEVYSGKATTENWNGKVNNSGELLPSGTYFYGLKLNDHQDIQYRGWVYLQY